MFGLLLEYRRQHNKSTSTPVFPTARYYIELDNWVDHQRQRYANNDLAPNRIARLEAIGFVWSPPTDLVATSTSTSKSVRQKQDVALLQRWIDNHKANRKANAGRHHQHQHHHHGGSSTVTAARYRDCYKSDHANACTNGGREWEEMFQLFLVQLQTKLKRKKKPKRIKPTQTRMRTTTTTTTSSSNNDLRLAKWKETQRRLHFTNKLPRIFYNRLESVGFEWEAAAAAEPIPTTTTTTIDNATTFTTSGDTTTRGRC